MRSLYDFIVEPLGDRYAIGIVLIDEKNEELFHYFSSKRMKFIEDAFDMTVIDVKLLLHSVRNTFKQEDIKHLLLDKNYLKNCFNSGMIRISEFKHIDSKVDQEFFEDFAKSFFKEEIE